MALFATNNTGSPVTLVASNIPVTIPAGATYNVTSELQGLSGPQYILLNAQMKSGSVSFGWVGPISYATPGLIPTAENIASIANIAALTGYANPGTPLLALITSNLSYYLFDPNATITSDGINVISPVSGSGRWIRQHWGHDQWRSQVTWFVDPISGNDENDGASSGTAIKTVKELSYRFGGIIIQKITINLLNNLPSSDALSILSLRAEWNPTLPVPQLVIIGQQTTARTGTITSAALAVPASNLAPQVSDSSVSDWTSDIGKMLVVTSGAATGTFCWIAKDLGSNTARTSSWMTSAFASASTLPSNGDTYKIVTLTDVANSETPTLMIGNDVSIGDTVLLEYMQFITEQVRPASPSGFRITFAGCKLNSVVNANRSTNWLGCYLTTFTNNQSTSFATMNCCLFAANLLLGQGSSSNFLNCVWQGGSCQVTLHSYALISNCGIFDVSASNGLQVQSGGWAQVSTALYGLGNLNGCAVTNGGVLQITIGLTPTITGTSSQLSITGGVNQIPKLVAGASVPATSACSTWAQWAAAPFSGFVMDYQTGARVIQSNN